MILIGNCEMKLSKETVMAILAKHLNDSMATSGGVIRVTDMQSNYGRDFTFDVTTDPLPVAAPVSYTAPAQEPPAASDNLDDFDNPPL